MGVRQEMRRMAELLLQWYDLNKRDLPWRNDPSPYQTWVSEIMLQQTRVEAVRGHYIRFMQELPDIKALAEASEDQYMKLWEGLGYYSRVRNLHKAAVDIMENHDGRMPESSEELIKLSGIGPYTSAAIASIAFGEKVPAVDGNLLRIFARICFYDENIKTDAAKKAAEEYFLQLMAGGENGRAGDLNQALMDLGAGVCLPNSTPLCGKCPWASFCEAHRRGKEMELPVMPEKKARKKEKYTVFVIWHEGRAALRKRPAKGLLAGLYEFPNTEGHLDENAALGYVQTLGFHPLRIRRLPEGRHIFTHKEWEMIGYEIFADELREAPEGRPREEIFMAAPEEIKDTYSVPSAFAIYQEYVR